MQAVCKALSPTVQDVCMSKCMTYCIVLVTQLKCAEFGSVQRGHEGQRKGRDPTLTPTWKLLIKA